MADRDGTESNPDWVRRLALTQDLPPTGLNLYLTLFWELSNGSSVRQVHLIDIRVEQGFAYKFIFNLADSIYILGFEPTNIQTRVCLWFTLRKLQLLYDNNFES